MSKLRPVHGKIFVTSCRDRNRKSHPSQDHGSAESSESLDGCRKRHAAKHDRGESKIEGTPAPCHEIRCDLSTRVYRCETKIGLQRGHRAREPPERVTRACEMMVRCGKMR